MFRHSIRTKMALLLTGIISALVVLFLVMNNTFSEKFYLSDKRDSMLSVYQSINNTMNDYVAGRITKTQMSAILEQTTNSAAISAVIVNSDWTLVYTNVRGDYNIINRLQTSIFNSDIFKSKSDSDKNGSDSDDSIDMEGRGINEDRHIIESTNTYTLQQIYDSRLQDDYYELWGTLDNGNSIMLRMAIQGIKDNVKILNKFITYIGIVVLLIGIVAAYIFSRYISRPILKLSDIAERMAELDFNVRYEGKDKGEIGMLGQSINNMSEKLEKNISQLKSANLELKRDIDRKVKIDEMRTDFLSNVSHELKTPISLIQGYAEGLKEGITDDPESTEFYCDVIIDEAAKMNDMVKKLLSLNQIEFGNEELVMERFDVVDLISSILDANKLRFEQNNITVRFEQKNENIYVWSDEYKIEEVITNYLSNAINHCEFDKIIDISIKRIDDNIRVSVFNTGKNIPQEDIDNIWIKFYKVDKARTREYGGNGIGLSIVKAIMDSYGKECGVINHENGVEFWFDLDGKA